MSATIQALARTEMPESQRLIAVSLGKIAASRGQRGGINLHKNLLVATVLHKARAAFMIQAHLKQRCAQQPQPSPLAAATPTPGAAVPVPENNVEMRDTSCESSPTSSAAVPSSVAMADAPSSSPRQEKADTPQTACEEARGGESRSAACHTDIGATATTTTTTTAAASPHVQVAEMDKENTPPPSPSPSGVVTLAFPQTVPDCSSRLGSADQAPASITDKTASLSSSSSSSSSSPAVSHASRGGLKNKAGSSLGCSGCGLLKRRRAMHSVHENVSAPKVRIVESRLSSDAFSGAAASEPMQCDSPISNLVSIFHSGLSVVPQAGGDCSVRSVGQSSFLSSSSSSSVGGGSGSNSLTCAKEMQSGLEPSLHQPLMLSV